MKPSSQRRMLLDRLTARLFEPVDLGLLVFFRIAFGAVMLWEVVRYVSGTRLERLYMQPEFYFGYYGFEWVKPWPGDGMYYHFYALGVLAVMIAAGLFYRVAAALFFVGFTYVFLLDETNYLNHFYLISLISGLTIFIPAHRAVSLDALRKPSLRSTTAPTWALWLLRFQIGVAYFYGGIAKLNSDWLAGEPMRMWLDDRFRTTVSEPVVWFFVYGGLLLDLLIVPFLLWRKTLIPAFVVCVLFHFVNDNLFLIGIFPWFMVAATLMFCPPEGLMVGKAEADAADDTGRRGKRRRETLAAANGGTAVRPATTRQKVVVALLGSYVLMQVLVPFRHFLYPGNVSWTEEGHRFAWHMKLRSKDPARARLGVLTKEGIEFVWEMRIRPDELTGRYTRFLQFAAFDSRGATVDLKDPAENVLNDRQIKSMATKPDMTLQFAHFLAHRVREAGYTPVEARADIAAALNGREPQQLIDPAVDLLEVDRNLAHADWVVPLTTPLERPSPLEMFSVERRAATPTATGAGDAELRELPEPDLLD